MVRKVVRDLEQKGPQAISLKDETVSTKTPKKGDVIDCSVIGKRKKVITGTSKKAVQDIAKRKLKDEKKEKIYFLHIDARENLKYNKMGDLIRLASAGLVILVVLNVINIYNRGLTLKNDIIASAYSGYQELLTAGEKATESDFAGAEQTFNQAALNFDSAMEEISFLQSHHDYFLTKEKTVDSAQGLLDAAKNISLAGRNFARGIENLRYLPSSFIYENSKQILEGSSGETGDSLTEKLKVDLAYIQTATEQINIAQNHLADVSPDVLPPGFRDKLDLIKEKTKLIYNLLVETQQKIPAVLNMLGDRYPHRYLILLQNDTEARPTGGFIGSYLIVDLNDGYITKFEFHDVYELDGQFYEYIEPPEDIALVADNWRMRDSNYSPDFTVSAEKTAWFLQKEHGPSVDSIIAINLSFVEDLLEVTGPLQISSLNAPLTKFNFQFVISYIVESKLSGDDKPKEIMKELIPAFQNKLATEVELDKLLMGITKGFDQKKIMLYSKHQNIQELFDQFNASNRITETSQNEDYLQVVTTSIGGNKSDRFINQRINHYSLIQGDGTVMDEVSVSRQHSWNGKDLESWHHILSNFGYNDLPPHIIDILGRGENKSFIKIYVPYGSTLVDVAGIGRDEVYTRSDEELNKTYFMYKMSVKPLSTEKVSITYELPVRLKLHPADTYRFHSQNQPSYKASFLEKKIYFKPGLQSYSKFPDSFKKTDDGSLIYSSEFDSDLYLSALVGT